MDFLSLQFILSACLTDYSKSVVFWLIVSLAHPFHAPFIGFKISFETVYTAVKAPFSILVLFVERILIA